MIAPINYKHPVWGAVCARLDERIAQMKDELSNPLDADKTAALRGRIAMAREILNWPDQDEPNQPEEGIDFYV